MGEGGEGGGSGGRSEANTKEGASSAQAPPQLLIVTTNTATPTQVTDSTMTKDSESSPDGAHEKMLQDDEKKLTKTETCEVKFVSGEHNGDAKIDIMDVKQTFTGLTKEELMKYCNDPFWVRLRWIMFVAFWLIWIGMLVGAIVIIIGAPKCAPPAPKTWWEEGPIVELDDVDNQLAYDSALSDLSEKVPALEALKIQGIYIPESPNNAYIISDSPAFTNLAAKAKKSDIQLIVDLTPNYAEKVSEWFTKSEQKQGDFTDYFIWASGVNPGDPSSRPNDWVSTVNEPAWTYSDVRKQFYLHQFNKSTPDLNFRNPNVIREFDDVIKHWIKQGATGIRLSKAKHLLVDPAFANESPNSMAGTFEDYSFYAHTKTTYQNGLAQLLAGWKKIILDNTDGKGLLTLKEDLESIESLKNNGTIIVDLPKSSRGLVQPISAKKLQDSLKSTFSLLEESWASWQYSDESMSSELKIVSMLLPGTPILKLDQIIKPTEDNSSKIVGSDDYNTLVGLRALPTMKYGTYNSHLLKNDTIFGFTRLKSGNPGYVILLNPKNEKTYVNATVITGVPPELTVAVLSDNYNIPDVGVKNKLSSQNITMAAKSAIVLTYVPKQDE